MLCDPSPRSQPRVGLVGIFGTLLVFGLFFRHSFATFDIFHLLDFDPAVLESKIPFVVATIRITCVTRRLDMPS